MARLQLGTASGSAMFETRRRSSRVTTARRTSSIPSGRFLQKAPCTIHSSKRGQWILLREASSRGLTSSPGPTSRKLSPQPYLDWRATRIPVVTLSEERAPDNSEALGEGVGERDNGDSEDGLEDVEGNSSLLPSFSNSISAGARAEGEDWEAGVTGACRGELVIWGRGSFGEVGGLGDPPRPTGGTTVEAGVLGRALLVGVVGGSFTTVFFGVVS
ncbi:hypothetical protein BDZ89DRAFT_1054798, partial [Hymenopellis radicata]